MFKKLFFVFFIFFISCTMLKNKVYADELKLSEMSYEQQLAYLNENNIVIPEWLESSKEFPEFLTYIFLCLEYDINYPFNFNYNETRTFVLNIQNSYKLNKSLETAVNIFDDHFEQSRLLYNLVYDDGEWKDIPGDVPDHFEKYNCYDFVLDRLEEFNFYRTYDKSYKVLDIGMTTNENWTPNWTVSQTANLIIQDLMNLGYENIEYSTTLPININGKDLICCRYSSDDFHFMKYDQITNSWYHKVGQSPIFKYIGVIDDEDGWYKEWIYNGKIYGSNFSYNSSPIYITYDSNNLEISNYTDYDIDKSYTMCKVSNDSLNSYVCNDMIYELNVVDQGTYFFNITANNCYEVKFFDCIGREIEDGYYINNDYLYSNISISRYLEIGKLYLKVSPIDLNSTLDINIEIKSLNYTEVCIGTNNVTNYLFNNGSTLTGNFVFEPNECGMYKIEIKGCKDESLINFITQASINAYDDLYQTDCHINFTLNDIDYFASSDNTSLFVYFPDTKMYYINVIFDYIECDSVQLVISHDEMEFDLTNSLTETKFEELFSNNYIYGYYKKVYISHPCYVTLDCLSYEPVINDISIVVFKQSFDEISDSYYLNNIMINYITQDNRLPSFNIILEKGEYYFGYFNNEDCLNITFAMERNINQDININDTIIADPSLNQGYPIGTEVLYNNGECNNYTITEGFTRNLFITQSDDQLYPISRLEYYWFSSNENFATVTNFGTVLAQPVNEIQTVIIYAILKSDPSIVFKKTFNIINDTSLEQLNIYSTMSYSYSQNNGEIQIALNYNNSPYPYIQYYLWNVNTDESQQEISISIDYWGFITSTGYGSAIITGTYVLNPRVRLIIDLTITE